MIIIRIKREIPRLIDNENPYFRFIRISPILIERETHPCGTVAAVLQKFVGIDVESPVDYGRIGKRYIRNPVAHAVGGIGKGQAIVIVQI